MKNVLLLFLVTAILTSGTLTACSEKISSDDGVSENGSPATYEGATEAHSEDTAPDETEYDPGVVKTDYQGYTFNIMDRADDSSGWWISMDIYAEGLNGEAINDAVYARNELVNDYFNINIQPYTVVDTDFKVTLKNSAAANDNLVDLTMLTLGTAITSSQENLLFDLNTFDVFNPETPYYTHSILKDTSIYNRNYLVVGDMTLIANEGTWTMMFNKQVAENYKIEDLYELVRNGEWTIDKMYSLVKDIGTDDGNGKADLNDFFGLLTTGDAYPAFLYGLDYKIIEKDEEDGLIYRGFTERLSTAAEKLLQILDNDTITCHGQFGGDWSNFQIMFEANQSLFYSEVLQCVTRLRNMDVDFGVLPLPKLDEIQDTYHTNIHQWASDVLTIPTAVLDPEMSANVFEYLAFASSSTLRPAYYDKVLTYKAMRDEESVEMLDYLLEGRVVDIGYLANVGGIYGNLMNQLNSGNTNLASFFQKSERVADKQLEKFLASYKHE